MRISFEKIARLSAMVLVSVLVRAQGISPGSNPIENPAKILQFLSATVSWYRERATEQKLADQPSDLAFVQEGHRVADQIVQQAFDYARNQAQLQAAQRAQQAAQPQAANQGQYQGLNQALQKLDQQIRDTQAELQSNRDKLAKSSPAKRRIVQSQVEELQGELELLNARRDAIESMAEFVNTSNTGNAKLGLRAQIEELAASVPAALSRPQGSNQNEATTQSTPPAPTAINPKSQSSGIWGLATDLIHLSDKVRTLNGEISSTEALRKDAADLRAPLLDYLRNLIKEGDRLFAAADTATAAQLAQQRQQLDALTAQFKQATAPMLPLGKADVLLGIYESTLKNWRDAIHDEERDDLRQLLLRLGVLVVFIGLVFAIGEIWRRASFRYVHDARRRYQFLLLRRIVIWTSVVLIVVLTFASQLGSAVTFAGLITAGVAVAMQSVITSMVGYFFLIGKYGVRIGDRVQIAGVAGEVVDIGLVRIHLMELGGPSESQPTGRIVAFSNSVVFQSGPGIFKQIPGTNFVWHELKLTLAGETNYHEARDRITKVVDAAFAGYREDIDMQRQMVERSLTTVSALGLQPKVRLHYTGSGIEVVVRYPVELEKAAEVDDRLMRELMADMEKEPKLKLVSAEMPVSKA